MSTQPPADDSQLDLSHLQQAPEDQGISLEELSQAYAQLLDGGTDPYEHDGTTTDEISGANSETPPAESLNEEDRTTAPKCQLTPRAIFESMLFVGHPHNEPLSSKEVALLMRGVRPREVDELVVELNESYRAEGCPYEIVSDGGGYRLALRPDFEPLRGRFYGKVRQARLSQAAIDTLAIIAYHQPLTRDRVDELRGKPSSGILSQLVRRELLRIERPADNPRKPHYHTTDRFLDVFGLETLSDLPQTERS